MVLGGGATRMGKTSLVHLVIVHSLLSTKGEIDITVCSPKIADFHMFRNVPQIKIAETPEETADAMEHVVSEMELRKEILKGYGDVKDIHSLREKHKEATLNPVLVIVDEFGAYSNTKHDSHCKRVHEYATEIACRAGYVDIHLIAFSQRTDVTQVFPPQVKNNMLCKIAFTTADENNSRLIIGTPDAAHLGAIKGRAILIDGLPELVQVPYLSEEDIITLMEPYVRSEQHDEPRQADDSVPSALPNFVSGAVGEIDLPGSSEAESDDKPNRKTPSKGRTPARRTPAKR